MNMKSYRHIDYIKNVLPCVGFGILCGSLTGAVIFLFKLAARQAEALSRMLYGMARLSLVGILITFVLLVGAALLMALLHRRIPESVGGGIPRSKGILRGTLSFSWLRTLFGTFVGSMLSFFCGLPLGSEGPAVLIGTCMGRSFGSISRSAVPWERYVMTGGASAGFAIATGAPLSGILFGLEEIHKRFTPMLVITVSLSTLAATYVNTLLCSLFDLPVHLFDIPSLPPFALADTGYLLLLGLGIAVSVALFDGLIYLFRKTTARYEKHFPPVLKLILFFCLTGVLGLFLTSGAYGGHEVVEQVLLHREALWFLVVILLIRLVMMLLATDSGATGGFFIPTLALGVLVSALLTRLLILLGMPSELYMTTVLLGMCAFLGGSLRAPLTAAVFFVELTGQFINLFYVALVIFLVNFLIDFSKRASFYDRVMERMEQTQNQGRAPTIAYFEMKVSPSSFVVGKAVRDVMWPPSAVVLGITRDQETEEDMDHDGEKKIYTGDTLVIRVRFYDKEELFHQLHALVGTDFPIQEVSS